MKKKYQPSFLCPVCLLVRSGLLYGPLTDINFGKAYSQEAKQPYFSGVFVQPPSFHLINHKSNEKSLFKSTSMLLEWFKNCHLQMLTVVKFREFFHKAHTKQLQV